MIDVIVFLMIPALLGVLGWSVGTINQTLHERRLDAAEAAYRHIPISDLKTPSPHIAGRDARVVVGSVVLCSDYFRTFSSRLRRLIGGEMGFYRRLMERGRREAIARMMEQAKALDAAAVINLRLETSSLAGLAEKSNPTPQVEVIAYGTAVLEQRQRD